jgi:hypothetical protein
VFIEVIINSYASPVFFSPRTKTITIEKEKDLHASSSSFFFIYNYYHWKIIIIWLSTKEPGVGAVKIK